jgi:hypothetical protein
MRSGIKDKRRFFVTVVLVCFLLSAFVLPIPIYAGEIVGLGQNEFGQYNTAGTQMLHGHVPAVVAQLQPVSNLSGSERLHLAIGLPLRNQAMLTELLQRIYNPASPDYHHYLTPEQFAEMFGPTEQDYQAVITFAKSHRLTVTGTHPNRMLLDVDGSVTDIEKAMHVTMHVYRHPKEARTFYAPDVEPSLDLAVPVLGISGLDNYELPRPRLIATPLANVTNVTPNAGSGPGGTYMGNDFRAAYVPDSSLTGSGQIVGLLQFDGYTASDITYYESQAGLPNITLTNVLIDGASGNPSGDGGEVEVSLDIEMAISMAPGLSEVVVYIAPNPSPWEDLLNRMATDNLAKQLSCSWYWPGGTARPTCDQIFQQMAAQGQSFFNASGDYDAYTGLIDFPGDTNYITQVGGTTLTTSGPDGAWVSETVWNRGNGKGSGGGISTQYLIPAWQASVSMATNQGSTTMRNTPDVALTADNVYVRADGKDYGSGGTSCAAPLWGGFTALINQQAAASCWPAVGFINPAVYAIGTGTNYTSCFHDITTGNNTSPSSPNKFYAVAGYDLCTGWGTPAGQNLISALAAYGAFSLTKVDDGDCVGPGRYINYTIDYDYHPAGPNCPDIDDVNIIDNLPAEVEFILASDGGSYDSSSHTVIWNLGVIHPGGAGSVTLKVRVKYSPPGSTITNECQIRGEGYPYRTVHEHTPVALAAQHPWDNQLEWKSTAADGDWSNPANWSQEGDLPCPPNGPGGNNYCSVPNYCCVLPNKPDPCITGNAQCSMLSLNPWDPTPWGGQDTIVTITDTALNVNFGAAIQINSQVDYDSKLGGKAILNVYGGTVTTPNPANSEDHPNINAVITIGGGASHYGQSYGQLNMYGGEVNVPRFALYYGDTNLYGGTLLVNTDSNFYFNQSRPENTITMNGGTLKIRGNWTAPLNALIGNGRIVSNRGTLGTPTYPTYDADGAEYTTLTSTGSLTAAWNPQPANGAKNVHYYHGIIDACSVTLSWNKGDYDYIDVDQREVNVTHNIYFGTSAGALVLQKSLSDVNNDPCQWDINDVVFTRGATYYWEVNEVNTIGSQEVMPGPVWNFTVQDGKAYNPRPRNGQVGLNEPLSVSWTAGDWANVHRVFFGTNYSAVTNASTAASDGRYRGTVSSPVYPLSRLLEVVPPASVPFPGTLTPGTPLYWRIDEVDDPCVWKGPVWSFTPAAYITIEDFEDYNSTADINANWAKAYCTGDTTPAFGNLSYVLDSAGRHGKFHYDNTGTAGSYDLFSEVNRPYIGGTVFTGSAALSVQPAVIRVDYIGTSANSAIPIYDRMYVALEDTAGNVGVYSNSDGATQANPWQQWYIPLNDPNFTSVNKAAIRNFRLGVGLRCNDGSGGYGDVMFDNIRLYAKTCNPNPPFDVNSDMDGDCDVDVNDLDVFVNDWLAHAEDRTFAVTQPTKAPILWYQFNDSGSTTLCADSGATLGAYAGTVQNWIPQNWDTTGGRDGSGCLYLPPNGGCYVDAPVAALGFMGNDAHSVDNGGGGISFSVWINADLTANQFIDQWPGIFGVWNPALASEVLEVHCPSNIHAGNDTAAVNFIKRVPIESTPLGGAYGGAYAQAYMPLSSFGGRWNHWAFIKTPSSPNGEMQVYCNGNLVADANGNDWASIDSKPQLFPMPVGAFRIGTRGSNWDMWSGKLDDFQVYDYALSGSEVAWLATDGTGEIKIPLTTKSNLYLDGGTANDMNQVVNFEDLSVMGDQWHQLKW